ncbi:anhydro-N-acetylmuramic acid kinase [Granulicella tundricola]
MREPKAMVVAGVMSGTSADGVDVAVVRVSPGAPTPKLKVIGHESFAYSEDVRAAVLRAMDAKEVSVAELSRLNWRLGEVYADCVEKTAAKVGKKIGLVSMHGQTIYHQGVAEEYLGAPVRATWQLGEAAVVAERMRVPVVSDMRPADLAAGGQGAPLVPMLDFCMFRSATKNRVLLNLGGIANVTAIPAGAGLDGLLAFDTGPANMVVDALMFKLYGRNYDCGGQTAARGRVLAGVVDEVMKDGYFSALPPKSCGREQYGAAFVARVHEACVAAGGKKADVIATATEITVRSVVEAYAKFCWSHLGQRAPLAKATELIAAGGGARNAYLMKGLTARFAELGVKVLAMDEMGVAAEAKEAAAFALLGWLSWFGMTGNVPSATGAKRGVVLGKVSLG